MLPDALGPLDVFLHALEKGLREYQVVLPPLLGVVVAESGRHGAGAGLRLVVGQGALELGMVAFLAMSLGLVLSLASLAFLAGLPGGLFLGWMAWRVYRGAPQAAERLFRPERMVGIDLGGGTRSLARLGAVATVVSPSWLAQWATVGQALEGSVAGLAAFYLGHLLAAFIFYGFVGTAVGWVRLLMSPRIYAAALRAAAFFLVYIAVISFATSVGRLFGGGG